MAGRYVPLDAAQGCLTCEDDAEAAIRVGLATADGALHDIGLPVCWNCRLGLRSVEMLSTAAFVLTLLGAGLLLRCWWPWWPLGLAAVLTTVVAGFFPAFGRLVIATAFAAAAWAVGGSTLAAAAGLPVLLVRTRWAPLAVSAAAGLLTLTDDGAARAVGWAGVLLVIAVPAARLSAVSRKSVGLLQGAAYPYVDRLVRELDDAPDADDEPCDDEGLPWRLERGWERHVVRDLSLGDLRSFRREVLSGLTHKVLWS